jgi:AhpD family alkylhydroperoxidase
MWFLQQRYEQLKGMNREELDTPVVADYIFEKDKLFAYINLSDAELALYNSYYQAFSRAGADPDLVIYLQATPEVLKQRLKRKGVPGERAVSDDYLEQVVAAYEHFFFHYTASDLLVVNTSDIDFVNNNQRPADAAQTAVGADQGHTILSAPGHRASQLEGLGVLFGSRIIPDDATHRLRAGISRGHQGHGDRWKPRCATAAWKSQLLELVKLRASQLNGCAYCIDMHTKDARASGETEQRLYGLVAWRESPFLTQRANGQPLAGPRPSPTSRKAMPPRRPTTTRAKSSMRRSW